MGVLTFISHAHTEFFKTIKKIAQEKRVIISHLSHDDFAVLNFDNELVMQNATATKAEIVTYGFKEGADLRASDVNIINDEATGWPSGLNFKVNFKGNTVPVFFRAWRLNIWYLLFGWPRGGQYFWRQFSGGRRRLTPA